MENLGYILLVLFVATTIRAAFGFGEALIAVPLLALRIPITLAAPLAVLVSITVAAAVIVEDREKIHLRSATWLVASTIFGIPLGLWLLTCSHQTAIKLSLAVLIAAYALYSLLGRKPPALTHDSRSWLGACGFLAGVLGGAYGMNGPPLVIYGTMRRWSARQFRATLQAYFLPASFIGMAGYSVAGLWTAQLTRAYLLTLPAVLAALIAGRFLHRIVQGDRFLRYVYFGLFAIALGLGFQTLSGSHGTNPVAKTTLH